VITTSFHCQRCGRRMKQESSSGFGPVCERSAYGTKPKRVKREDRRSADTGQRDLFQGAQA
jgi:hypothetical protein